MTNSPIDLFIDIEATHLQLGMPMWLGALLVNHDTNTICGKLELFINVPDNTEFSEMGANKYQSPKHIYGQKTLKDICQSALSVEDAGSRFLAFARPTTHSPIPRVYGYNHTAMDIPTLIRCFNLPPDHWLCTCEQVDVLHMAKSYWPHEQDRTLHNVAISLSQTSEEFKARINSLTPHTPVDDCELTLLCKEILEYNISHDIVPPPFIKEFPKPTLEEVCDWYTRKATINCPVQGCNHTMRLCKKDNGKGTLDDFFWQCTNPNHKNSKPKCRLGILNGEMPNDGQSRSPTSYGFTINVDGTQFHTAMCNVRDTLKFPLTQGELSLDHTDSEL